MSWLPFPVFVVAMNVFAILLRDEKEKGWILSFGMGLFCNWDMAKYILPSLGLILLAELVMCIGSEMRSALFLLIAQGSEWPEGLMSVDMQSISLDTVIYNDTAGQCIFSDNMKQWHSVQNAEYRRRCHRQTLGMDLKKLRWKTFSFPFVSFCFRHVLCSSPEYGQLVMVPWYWPLAKGRFS